MKNFRNMLILSILLLAGCATAPAVKNYSVFRAEGPRSILVVPVMNNTVSVTAPEFFLSTISKPFAERGYYVFPAHMIKRLMEDEGLGDPGLIHNVDATKFQTLFGCDSVLFITIQRWDAQYIILKTTTTVQFDYTLKSCKTGSILWSDSQQLKYSPQTNNTGNPIANLIVEAIAAAIEKAAPNYLPLTIQANALAAGTPGKGIPAGPYLSETYLKDQKAFQSANPK
jgi:hypothetical protein